MEVAGAAILSLAVLVGGSGCRHAAAPSTSSPQASGSAALQYPIRGVVVSTDAKSGEIDLNAGAVPGVMDAMTMTYPLTDRAALSELHPGDTITATLEADKTAHGPDNFRLSNIVVVGQAKPDYAPTVEYHVPTAGDRVPDFKLLNQSDKTIDLKQYRGKVVLMTFIYTRCPLADYCPRMSRNFAEIDQQLAKDPALYKKTHLLSVSFDPTYDTPKVLKSYGEAYTGRYTKETFQHWEFAAPSEKELAKMEQWFDVGVTPGANGTLQHSLATVVIGKDGKVVAFYPTKDWTVAAALDAVKQAAGS